MSSTITIGSREYEGDSISIMNKKVYVDGVVVEEGVITAIIKGDAVSVTAEGGVTVVGNVKGNVNAGGSIRCGNVEGNVEASCVDCGNVSGGIKVGSSVNCKKEKDYGKE